MSEMLPDELHEPLRAWAVNVMLECSHPDNDPPRLAIGGDVLDLRDLERLLDWMVTAHLPDPDRMTPEITERREA